MGLSVGTVLGLNDGLNVGTADGAIVGIVLGNKVGGTTGEPDGRGEGLIVGTKVGVNETMDRSSAPAIKALLPSQAVLPTHP